MEQEPLWLCVKVIFFPNHSSLELQLQTHDLKHTIQMIIMYKTINKLINDKSHIVYYSS